MTTLYILHTGIVSHKARSLLKIFVKKEKRKYYTNFKKKRNFVINLQQKMVKIYIQVRGY